MAELLTCILFLTIFFGLTGKARRGVFRMTKNRQMVSDLSDGAWTVSVLHDHVWLARFGSDWRRRYPTTWAVGLGTDVWFYTPEKSQ